MYRVKALLYPYAVPDATCEQQVANDHRRGANDKDRALTVAQQVRFELEGAHQSCEGGKTGFGLKTISMKRRRAIPVNQTRHGVCFG